MSLGQAVGQVLSPGGRRLVEPRSRSWSSISSGAEASESGTPADWVNWLKIAFGLVGDEISGF
ncbi:MAG: hypothetical protein JSS68_21310 [Actinobacteria bacterium]|nr:hypothetical protein [Actinomycetota bacterium]